MTFIEFFDKTTVENICACLTFVPDKIILLGSKSRVLSAHSQRYASIFEGRGQRVEIVWKSLNRNNLNGIIEYLSNIVETEEECAFGLTGGDDLFLTAAGIVYERYKDKHILLHRYNIHNNTVYDCDNDGKVFTINENSYLSVAENVKVYGGEVVFGGRGTTLWSLTDDFKNDILAAWSVCKQNPKRWNSCIGQGVSEGEVIEKLEKYGLVKKKGNRLEYKNSQVKNLLTKSGLALELIIYLAGKQACDEFGKSMYNDVLNGVCIDWDGITDADAVDTQNEIDVMYMHGMIPVFISCKNGAVDTEELYKLNSVAHRFGGLYAKKVLVATSLDKMGSFSDYFRQRAVDMNIRIIEGVQDMSFEELTETVKNFWVN